MILEIKNLAFKMGNKKILNNVELCIPEKKFVGIIGPNGAGKSTLLKNIYGIYQPSAGDIFIEGQNIKNISKKERARKIAVLAQEDDHQFDFNIEQIVEMGRYPYKKIFENYSHQDREIAEQMLKKTGMENYIGRNFRSLSGGEKQRVLIARALAQLTPILVLDEPTNHLDIGYQLQILHLVKHLDITVIAALHDLNMAAIFCDYIFVMKDGRVVKEGTAEEVFTPEILREIFGIECYVGKNPMNQKMQIAYMTGHYNI